MEFADYLQNGFNHSCLKNVKLTIVEIRFNLMYHTDPDWVATPNPLILP